MSIITNMQFFDGPKHAELLTEAIQSYLKQHVVKDKLAIIQIGDNQASEKYVSIKEKYCSRLGILCEVHKIPSSQEDSVINSKVREVFNDTNVSGGIIQLPLPRLSLKSVLNSIPQSKDIDCISSINLEQFYAGNFTNLSPVIRSFDYFISQNNLKYDKLNVVIIGKGELVGRPLEHFLLSKKAKIHVLENYKSGDFINSDLLILSAGAPNLVNGSDISPNTYVVDFGSSVVNGKTVGDLNLESDLSHLEVISPSPKGMGPLVVRFLIMKFLGI